MPRNSPFIDPADPPLLVHCGYHKVGTVWFSRILEGVSSEYRLRLEKGEPLLRNPVRLPTEEADVFIDSTSRIRPADLPDFRGSHMVRDPRDMAVSGYFYHVWTEESWAHEPGRLDNRTWIRPEWKGMSYHDILDSLSKEEGLAVEIRRAKDVFRRMFEWDYEDERFHEMRYPEVIADEDAAFAAMFTHYGFTPEAVQKGVEIARSFSFKNVAKRDIGEKPEGRSHLRSGRPGEWREHFTDAHRRLFEELYPGLVVKLGFETSSDW